MQPHGHCSGGAEEYYYICALLLWGKREKSRDKTGPLIPAGLPKSSKNWKCRIGALEASHRSQLLNCILVMGASV